MKAQSIFQKDILILIVMSIIVETVKTKHNDFFIVEYKMETYLFCKYINYFLAHTVFGNQDDGSNFIQTINLTVILT